MNLILGLLAEMFVASWVGVSLAFTVLVPLRFRREGIQIRRNELLLVVLFVVVWPAFLIAWKCGFFPGQPRK